jgi:hypothetical protein
MVLLALALLLQSCAGLVGGKEPVVGPSVTHAETGSVQIARGRPGIVIGVPDTGPDTGAARVGRDLARLTGFGIVVAAGPSGSGAAERLDGAPRPESDFGPATQVGTARRPDAAYRRQISEAARGPLALYVELRGDAERPGRVDIATAGLDREEIWRLKTLFELIRDARVDGGAGSRLEVSIEPPDPRLAASLAPPGTPVAPRRSLRIELPRLARTTYREIYTEMLGDFLVQAAAFLAPPVR